MKLTQSHIKRLAFLTATILFTATLELLIPKPFPFFKLGLANLILMISLLVLSKKEFILLVLIKVFVNSFLSGTLLSPIFIISLSSSLTSGLIMMLLYSLLYKRKIISFIGISILSALSYNLLLLKTSSMFLFSPSIWYLSFPLILTGFISSLIIGILLEINIKNSKFILALKTIDPDINSNLQKDIKENKWPLLSLLILIVIYFATYKILLVLAILLTIITILLKLKINIKATIITTITIIISQLLIKKGLVIYQKYFITITYDSLINGIYISLYLYCLLRIGSIVSKTKIKIKNNLINSFFNYLNVYKSVLKHNLDKSSIKELDIILYSSYIHKIL